MNKIQMLQMLVPFIFEAKTYGHLPKIHSRRFWGIDQFGFAAYKTDAEIALEKKQKDDEKAITDKEAELKAIKIEKPEDFTKAFQLYKEIAELKGKNLDEKLAAIESAQKQIKEAAPEVTAEQHKKVVEDLAATVRALDIVQARVKSTHAPQQQFKSFDQQIKDALIERTDDIEKMARKDQGRKDFTIQLKTVGDIVMANVTGGTRSLTALRPGIIELPNRKVHMRDIIPTGTIGPGTEYVFMKENGLGEGAIAPVAEGALKPQLDLDLIEASVKIETIAGWMRVTRKAMSNIPGFVSFIQAKLPEKLLKVEDVQILTGDGNTPNLKGIMTAGNFTAADGSATIDIEQIVQAISQLEELDREATGIVVRPADYYRLLLNKAAGSGEYDNPAIVTVDAMGTLRVLGIPVVHTTAMTLDKFLVGDFRQGAQFLIQEGMNIGFFEQDGDNVRYNKVTIRIEETVALPVYGDTYFIVGDFGAES